MKKKILGLIGGVSLVAGMLTGFVSSASAAVVPCGGDLGGGVIQVCGNGPTVPYPPGYTFVPRSTDLVATPDNCPIWYGWAGCMRRPN